MRRLACSILLLLATSSCSLLDAAERHSLRSLSVAPESARIQGLRGQQQLLVSGETATSSRREVADLTREATYESLSPTIALVTPEGLVVPRGTGTAEIRVRVGSLEQKISVKVDDVGDERVDYRTDVIAALSRAGCNQGACHGSPQGKGGFRLSLRGFDPTLDYDTLVRENGGRRTNPCDPDGSLMLRKALGVTPHQGGVRFRTADSEYQALRAWILQGCRPSTAARKVTKLEVLPALRRLPKSHLRQQLVALAHFDDGTVRDVTHMAVFSTGETAADVNKNGLVEFHSTAEASILVRYLDKVVSSRLTWVRHDPEFAFRLPRSAAVMAGGSQSLDPSHPTKPSHPPEHSHPANFIDERAFAKQRELQVQPADVASDAVFLRRVHLDAIGTLPTADESRAFLDSTDPAKRAKLIDQLLERDEYAKFWALKWADVMRGSDVTISRRGVFSFHRYLVDLFRRDRPFDDFARETLTGLGNTLYSPPANFFRVARTPEDMAEAMSQLFLGVRIGCARCHNHPFESITQGDYYGFAAYFARVKFKGSQFGLDDEIVHLDRRSELRHPALNQNVAPAAFGSVPALGPDNDRRAKLAEWLTASDNPYFARSIVNRLWYHVFGRGIVEPVDDFRETNPPSDPELLNALAEEFAKGGYRIKPVLRLILNSKTYQLSSTEAANPSKFEADPDKYFARAQVRMLMGEQILDAISSATGVPAAFDGYPEGTRAIELAEGAVEHPFLQAFSKPVRDATCECARDGDTSIGQVIHLLNNPDIAGNLTGEKSRLRGWIDAGKSDAEITELLYLATLSRRPTSAEKDVVAKHVASVPNRQEAFGDLQHALINSNEFLLRH